MTESAVRLAPGDPAPPFILLDQDGSEVSLQNFSGRKTILYFYPQADTPGCTKEACDFRDNLGSLAAEGYQVVGISRDKPEKLKKFQTGQGLNFPLISDPDNAVHALYGAWGEKNLYGKVVSGVLRSTFVLDEQGVITLALYNVKATGHVASLRKKLGLA